MFQRCGQDESIGRFYRSALLALRDLNECGSPRDSRINAQDAARLKKSIGTEMFSGLRLLRISHSEIAEKKCEFPPIVDSLKKEITPGSPAKR